MSKNRSDFTLTESEIKDFDIDLLWFDSSLTSTHFLVFDLSPLEKLPIS